MTAPTHLFDPLLPKPQAEEMIRLCERHGSYGTYSEETLENDFGGLPQRYDAAMNFVRTGGRFGRREPLEVLASRTNYMRETYAYGAEVRLHGIEPFQRLEGFLEAARQVHGAGVVEPGIVYANILLPGQELAVHTDVPEFRGMTRKTDPQWLLVAMHHSGLFRRWYRRIVTGIAYFHECKGGDLVYYPDGRDGEPRTLPVRHNTAILLDTDSVFHGVDRVEGEQTLPRVPRGSRLVHEGGGAWRFCDEAGETRARYRWGDFRFSISWKGYCYADAKEARLVHEHGDDLTRAQALEGLVRDLRERGRLEGPTPEPRDLALLLIDEYIRFPASRPEAAAAVEGAAWSS